LASLHSSNRIARLFFPTTTKEPPMATGKIYVVTAVGNGDGRRKRLVRAANATQAWRRVAEEMISVDLASQDDLVELAGSGVKVEDATATTQPE
jgi:hypothetical protein